MANISAIKLPSGNTYNLKDNGALQLTGGQVTGPVTFGDSVSIDEATLGDLVVNGSASFTNNVNLNKLNNVAAGNTIEYIVGTQTASTNVWTGVSKDSVLYDGKMIIYVLPYAGTSTGATLDLTLSDGTTTGAKGVYRYGATTQITTHYAALSRIFLIYDEANNRWNSSAWSDSNTVDRLRDSYFRPYAGEAVYRYKFVMQGVDNRMYPIVLTNQTSATQVAKEPTQVGLRPGRIWYYNTTATVAAAGLFAANTLDQAFQTTAGAYNFNTTAPAYRMIYLRGTYDKTTDLFTLYKDSSSPCTSYYTYVPTNTANITLSSYFVSDYYYILLGGTYSSDNYVSLFLENPLYYFDGTNLIPVSTKVAIDTDTKNTAGSTNSTSKLYLVGATSQTTNSQTYSNNGLYFNNGLYAKGISGNYESLINQTYKSIKLQTSSDNYDTSITMQSTDIVLGIDGALTDTSIYIDDDKIAIRGSDSVEYITVTEDGSVSIKGLVTPTNNSDAATKKYVDDAISGFITVDEKLKWTASTSTNTYYPLQSTSTATTSTANTLNGISFYQYYNTAGGYRCLQLGNTTSYTSSGGAYGAIRLYGTGATYYGELNPGTIGANSLTANRTWTLPNATGTIALTSDIFKNTTATLTTADWSSNSQTVTVNDITASSTVIASPAPTSYETYCKSGVYCSAQGTNSLTFKCSTTPNSALTINILYK